MNSKVISYQTSRLNTIRQYTKQLIRFSITEQDQEENKLKKEEEKRGVKWNKVCAFYLVLQQFTTKLYGYNAYQEERCTRVNFSHPYVSQVTLVSGVRQEVFSVRYLSNFKKGQVSPVHHFYFENVHPFFLFVVMIAHGH